jgi:hypothetical protein
VVGPATGRCKRSSCAAFVKQKRGCRQPSEFFVDCAASASAHTHLHTQTRTRCPSCLSPPPPLALHSSAATSHLAMSQNFSGFDGDRSAVCPQHHQLQVLREMPHCYRSVSLFHAGFLSFLRQPLRQQRQSRPPAFRRASGSRRSRRRWRWRRRNMHAAHGVRPCPLAFSLPPLPLLLLLLLLLLLT